MHVPIINQKALQAQVHLKLVYLKLHFIKAFATAQIKDNIAIWQCSGATWWPNWELAYKSQ